MAPIRKRAKRREGEGSWRFITCSCNKRLPLFDDDSSRLAFVEALIATHERHAFRLLAWVLMPEHFHLMILPLGPDARVSRILHGLKTPLSQRIGREWRISDSHWLSKAADADGRPRVWLPGGGFDRNVRDDEEL